MRTLTNTCICPSRMEAEQLLEAANRRVRALERFDDSYMHVYGCSMCARMCMRVCVLEAANRRVRSLERYGDVHMPVYGCSMCVCILIWCTPFFVEERNLRKNMYMHTYMHTY